MALMKLIVFVEFCLIPNCFLPPTAEVGGKLIHQVVASQNNFLSPWKEPHWQHCSVDAFHEFVNRPEAALACLPRVWCQQESKKGVK